MSLIIDSAMLIERCKKGDRQAFDQLLRQIAPQVGNVARSIVGDADDAQDVMQNVFIRVIDNIRSFKKQSNFSTWVYRIAVNESIKYYNRVIKRRTNSDRHDMVEKKADGERSNLDRLEAQELQEVMKGILAEMPVKKRTAFSLFYYSEMNLAEISETLGVPLGTVKSRICLTKNEIRKKLEKRGYLK